MTKPTSRQGQRGFVAGGLFADAVAKCRGRLTQLMAAAEPPSADGGMGDRSLSLGDFARSYTMQAERDVHTSSTRPAGAPPTLRDDSETVAEPGLAADLGDDFELF